MTLSILSKYRKNEPKQITSTRKEHDSSKCQHEIALKRHALIHIVVSMPYVQLTVLPLEKNSLWGKISSCNLFVSNVLSTSLTNFDSKMYTIPHSIFCTKLELVGLVLTNTCLFQVNRKLYFSHNFLTILRHFSIT